MIGQPFEIVCEIVVPAAAKRILQTGEDSDGVFKMSAETVAFLRMGHNSPGPRKLPASFQ